MPTKLDDIIKRNKQKRQQSNKDRPVRPPEGKSVWRIMPGWDEKEPLVFFHAYGQHYIKNSEGKIRAVIGCPDRTFEKPCEICDMLTDAIKETKDDKMRDVLKDMRAGQIYLLNAVRIDDDKSKPVIMQMPKGLFEGAFMDALEEYGEEMLDLQEGNDIVITREGKGLDTKYSLVVRSQAKSTPIDKSVFHQIQNLSEYVQEDFDAKKAKAIEAIGEHLGELPGMGGYGGPGTALEDKRRDADLDDDLGGYDGGEDEDEKPSRKHVEDAELLDEKAEEPSEDEKKEAEKSFGDEISDADLDDLLKGI